MKKVLYLAVLLIVILGVLPAQASADTIEFTAILSGANEVPPNMSTAVGLVDILFNSVSDELLIQSVTYEGLTTPATAGLIHVGAPGTTGPVTISLGITLGDTFGNFSNPTPVVLNALQVSELEGSLLYVNIHDTQFPGGEIRGQLLQTTAGGGGSGGSTVPEPSTVTLVAAGMIGLLSLGLKKHA